MATTMKLIGKTTLGSSASNVEFTSIPGTHTDLVLVCSTRSDRGGVGNGKILVTFNSSTSGYSYRTIRGSGSAASSSSASSQSALDLSAFTATSAGQTSNTFSSTEAYIPNYAGSTNKSVSSTTVGENNATEAYILAIAGLWADTGAITSLKVAEESGYNFVSGSSFFLYGITKA